MVAETPGSKPAKILYRPFGMAGSILGGIVAGKLVNVAWKHATPGDSADAPKPLESQYKVRQIVVAAAVQGMTFAVVKALVDRGGARLFQRFTGEWPGN